MYLVASVCPSVCPSVRPSVSALTAWLCRVQQRAKKSYYQSMMFVCVSSSLADAVNRLLINNGSSVFFFQITKKMPLPRRKNWTRKILEFWNNLMGSLIIIKAPDSLCKLHKHDNATEYYPESAIFGIFGNFWQGFLDCSSRHLRYAYSITSMGPFSSPSRYPKFICLRDYDCLREESTKKNPVMEISIYV